MADNIRKSKNSIAVWSKILHKLGHKTTQELQHELWESSGAPTVDAGSQGTYPVAIGQVAYDYTNDDNYVCSVAPAASTAATFIKMNA